MGADNKLWKYFFYIVFLSLYPLNILFCLHSLSFEDAVFKTLALSPELKIADNEITEKAGLTQQSTLYPNPVFAYSVENILGNKNWQGWESAESRYEIAQLIEMGGKREFKYQTAKFQYYAAQAGFEAKKLHTLNKLLKLFTLAAAYQEFVELALNQVEVAEEIYKTVIAKVEAGKVSLIQKNKAQIALSAALINFNKANTNFLNSKEKLSILWGTSCPDFDSISFPFYEIDTPNPLEQCLSNLRTNPNLIRSQMEYLVADKNLNLEKSLAIPDLTVLVGYKTLQDTRNKGLIIGASMPLPFFDQNQGNIKKARAQKLKTQNQYIQLELALEKKLSISHKDLIKAYNEVNQMRTSTLHSANQSLDLAKEGYKEGKFEYLDMLDSQKTLFEVQEQYIQALLEYHQNRADIEYLSIEGEGW